MTGKKTRLKPTRKASRDLGQYALRAKTVRERFIVEARRFSDSAEIIRADRESRV
jgi:hypothetical protein